ncbi:hypothetical protein HGR_11037 [Hylemonella gracilis ATCC 19624]|uniref:Uncharacterized protein n=1 Tax=Hylemonella gracilis ATCC 19624 TaxID=887062 RepID=F3KUS3_9BURK|nr:hypothetical protein HGR_11037 [Hylemonella gracilis ATCC 19624]
MHLEAELLDVVGAEDAHDVDLGVLVIVLWTPKFVGLIPVGKK